MLIKKCQIRLRNLAKYEHNVKILNFFASSLAKAGER